MALRGRRQSTAPRGPNLTVTKAGSGTGTVTSAPAGISCGTSCSAFFTDGAVVTLTPSRPPTRLSPGWSGDADCADGSRDDECEQGPARRLQSPARSRGLCRSSPTSALAGSPIRSPRRRRTRAAPRRLDDTLLPFDQLHLRWRGPPAQLPARSRPRRRSDQLGAVHLSRSRPTPPPATTTSSQSRTPTAKLRSRTKGTTRELAAIRSARRISRLGVHGADDGRGRAALVVSETTRNQTGTAPAGASTTRFYLSHDGVLDGATWRSGSANVGTLLPGTSSAGSPNVTIPAGTAAGTWTHHCQGQDADNLIAETSQTNNTRPDTIVIGPDLIVSALSAPATSGAGFPITVPTR